MNNKKIINICETGLFLALVFIATFALKIPYPFGYLHLGDTMIFLAVILLGRKKGVIAGSLGAAMSDFFLGYMVWAGPTCLFKGLMAFTTGTLYNKLSPNGDKKAFIIAALSGGLLQCAGYTVATYFIYGGTCAAIGSLPGNLLQTLVGIVGAYVLYIPLNNLRKTEY